MKKVLPLIVAALLPLMPALAQDPMEQPEGPPPGMDEQEMGPPPAFEPPPPGERHEAQFVDRWLGQLKDKYPEEYARLQKLRETSPEEFRQALHEKLTQEKMRFRSRGDRHGPPPMNPEIMRIEKETMDISMTYRQAADATQKEQLQKDLRQKLEILFDLREKERQEHIRRIETDLANLKKSVDQRQSNRQQIIDRHLQELTEGDGLRW
jgi:hypothetical protein